LIEVHIVDITRYYHALVKRKNNGKTELIVFFEGANEWYY